MEAFKVNNLTFRYPETGTDVLKSISFSIDSGEFITLCGPSGCGKSTLLRNLKPALAPFGIKSGEILFNGSPIESLSKRELSQKIGFVMQSPDNQIVTDKVWHELAFGLESLGCDNRTIRKRVAETASFFGIQHWFDKNISELSGGQKQLLNLASIMAMQPQALILDEPTSQLDPIAAADFLACISKINRELGTTIIITEHRLDAVLPLSNRVLVLENGAITSFDTPENTGMNLKKSRSKTFLSMPAQMQIWEAADHSDSACPVTVAEGRKWLEEYAASHKLNELYPESIPPHSDKLNVELNNVWFRYEKDSPDVIKNLSLKAYEGEFIAILGGNGTGKSTMLSLINGLNKPYRGKVRVSDSRDVLSTQAVATLPQNPQSLFVKKTVLEDLQEVFDGIKIENTEKQELISTVISLCRLESFLNRHPYDLSGGEQQRAALAKILLLRPKILLLDEPTKGLDAEFKTAFAIIIGSLTSSGVTVIAVSHDVEFCAKYPHRCLMLFNGEIVAEGTPRNFFASNSFYVTSANRMSSSIINSAVTADDVIYCCTGKKADNNQFSENNLYRNAEVADKKESDNSFKEKNDSKLPLWKKILGIISACALIFGLIVNLKFDNFSNISSFSVFIKFAAVTVPVILLMISFGSKSKRPINELKSPDSKRRLTKRTIVSSAMILLAVPLTVFVGVTYLQDQKYLFISLLVMLECMMPFFIAFGGKKPQARELIIIAVLCAIAVAGRTVFYMLPQFKPVIAIVIISGVAFGGETGFLVGAVTMLVSNIIFQQGPWTPWQMFAAGIIGFIAGVLFKKGFLSRNRISLCLFGFLSTLLIYGGIMNFSSVILAHSAVNFETVLSFCVTGLPMDIIHALATVVFLFFGAEPMLEKLDRIKTKYGLINY
ncbi:MAG: ATP-binding cassette domain-containing protein [Clostridiales bacterium]|nr:ATP-binding cassette domain-containing protein [Clostridiales bacterium]